MTSFALLLVMAALTVMSPASSPVPSVAMVTSVPPLKVPEMVSAATQLVPVQLSASIVMSVGSISHRPPFPFGAAALMVAP